MKNFTIGVVTLLMSLAMSAQTGNADFEDFGLEPGERINNDITGEGFKSGLVSLPKYVCL